MKDLRDKEPLSRFVLSQQTKHAELLKVLSKQTNQCFVTKLQQD